MPTTSDVLSGDPVLGHYFGLDISGVVGYFTSIDGLGSESEVVEMKIMANGESVVRKQPGRLTWGDITLKRGLTTNVDIYDWIKEVQADPTPARKDGSIILYDATMTEVCRWNFSQAWPSKVNLPAMTADSGEVVVEEMTLVHEGITREA